MDESKLSAGERALARFVMVLAIGPGAIGVAMAAIVMLFAPVLALCLLAVVVYLALLYAWREAVAECWREFGQVMRAIGARLEAWAETEAPQ